MFDETVFCASSADEMLLAVCQVLEEATRSLAGNPPQGTVCDAAPCNSMVIRAFVGQLPASIMEQHDFLKQCTVEVPKLKFWPFGFVKRGEAQHLMTSFLGGFHIQKRFGLQFESGTRKVVLGQVYVCPECWVLDFLQLPTASESLSQINTALAGWLLAT